jgi:hypothetical protein
VKRLASLALLLITFVVLPLHAQEEMTVFAIVVHADALDAAFWTEEMRNADVLFAPANVRFVQSGEVQTGDAIGPVDDRAARDRLANHVETTRSGEPSRIHVFVTSRLSDVDAPGERGGVHWRFRRRRSTHYIILSDHTWPTTLAHELGHYFGNPHSRTPNNIMSYARDGETPPFFDALQIRRIRTHSRRFVHAGVEHE